MWLLCAPRTASTLDRWSVYLEVTVLGSIGSLRNTSVDLLLDRWMADLTNHACAPFLVSRVYKALSWLGHGRVLTPPSCLADFFWIHFDRYFDAPPWFCQLALLPIVVFGTLRSEQFLLAFIPIHIKDENVLLTRSS